MIVFSTPDRFPALKAMWQSCFGDDARYVDFVFESLLQPCNILVETGRDGQPRAMLCVEYMDIVAADGSKFPGAYVYAVGTSPEHRGKGLSTALMEQLHLYLADKGVCCSVLVPASEPLFDFYGQRGYERFSCIKKATFTAGDAPKPSRQCVLTSTELGRLDKIRDRFFGGGSLYVRWDRRYLDYIGRECRFVGGETVYCSGSGFNGYAVCYRYGGDFVVKELAVSPEHEADFLHALHARLGGSHYTIYFPADRQTNFPSRILPFFMIKWYDSAKRNAMLAKKGPAPYLTHAMD